tara:strand:- start:81999 stop:82496 length:498 start_codon:yes stop_codon:yes gene_type:complete
MRSKLANNKTPKTKAFTLVELLAVVALLCVLAGIVVPVLGSVQRSAARTKSKAQFAQYAFALELYKQEHGAYPVFLDTDQWVNLAEHNDAFQQALKPFYTFSEGEFKDGKLVDAFGNPNIYIVIAKDGHIPSDLLPVGVGSLRGSLVLFTQKLDGDAYEDVYSWQ